MSTRTATRERSILFSGEMIRAIMRDKNPKTMTRRIVKPQPDPQGENGGLLREIVPSLLANRGDLFDVRYDGDNPRAIRCPHGSPGDRLWVRETWHDYCPLWKGWWCGHGTQEGIAAEHRPVYKADDESKWLRGPAGKERAPLKWKSGRFMPKWASRITLEITGVRVERLQEISYRDCIAEGMPPVPCYDDGADSETLLRAIRDKYRALWDSINGKRAPWDSNPFVWCISFRRIKP